MTLLEPFRLFYTLRSVSRRRSASILAMSVGDGDMMKVSLPTTAPNIPP